MANYSGGFSSPLESYFQVSISRHIDTVLRKCCNSKGTLYTFYSLGTGECEIAQHGCVPTSFGSLQEVRRFPIKRTFKTGPAGPVFFVYCLDPANKFTGLST